MQLQNHYLTTEKTWRAAKSVHEQHLLQQQKQQQEYEHAQQQYKEAEQHLADISTQCDEKQAVFMHRCRRYLPHANVVDTAVLKQLEQRLADVEAAQAIQADEQQHGMQLEVEHATYVAQEKALKEQQQTDQAQRDKVFNALEKQREARLDLLGEDDPLVLRENLQTRKVQAIAQVETHKAAYASVDKNCMLLHGQYKAAERMLETCEMQVRQHQHAWNVALEAHDFADTQAYEDAVLSREESALEIAQQKHALRAEQQAASLQYRRGVAGIRASSASTASYCDAILRRNVSDNSKH